MANNDGDAVMKALYGLLSDTDQRVANNAAWVLSRSDSEVIRFLQRYQNRLIDLLMETKDETFRRVLFSILRRQVFDSRRLHEQRPMVPRKGRGVVSRGNGGNCFGVN
ncbi:MAG: hypothetical protein ACFN4H_04480 [Prevotella sp.]